MWKIQPRILTPRSAVTSLPFPDVVCGFVRALVHNGVHPLDLEVKHAGKMHFIDMQLAVEELAQTLRCQMKSITTTLIMRGVVPSRTSLGCCKINNNSRKAQIPSLTRIHTIRIDLSFLRNQTISRNTGLSVPIPFASHRWSPRKLHVRHRDCSMLQAIFVG